MINATRPEIRRSDKSCTKAKAIIRRSLDMSRPPSSLRPAFEVDKLPACLPIFYHKEQQTRE